MTLANKVTVGRLVVAAVYFVPLTYSGLGQNSPRHPWVDVSLAMLVVALLTDALDGWLARRRNEVTDFGRIADPFVDKIAVCGSFVFFLTFPALQDFLPPWMVVVVISREFIVHGLRSAVEAKGVAFGASFGGKIKMVLQSAVAVGGVWYSGWLVGQAWATAILHSLVWVMLISTVQSGLAYVLEARRAFLPREG